MLALLYLGPWLLTAGLLYAFGVFDDDDEETAENEDTITGTEGDDMLVGSEANDEVVAKGGNDEVWTLEGSDSVFADDGNDTIIGGAGDDLSRGGAGDDYIYDVEGSDTIVAGAGNDTVYAAAMADGFDDSDVEAYLADDDATFAELTTALFAGETFSDDPDADEGDEIKLGRGDDAVVAGAGDTVTGGAGADQIGVFLRGEDAGEVTVTDFDAVEDYLVVYGSGGTVTFTASANESAEVRVDDVVVALLQGVDAATLDASSVVFASVGERP